MPKAALNTRDPHTAKMVLAIALTVVTFLCGTLTGLLAPRFGLEGMIPRTIMRGVVSVICMVALGGASWFAFDLQKIRDAWRFARPLVMINVVMGVIAGSWGVLMLLALGELGGEAQYGIFQATVLCIFVGINEEVMFRGLLFGGLLAGIGNRKNGPLTAALISSLIFGFMHVAFDLDPANPMGLMQGLLKTIETGMFGFILCVPVLEGRNLLGAITVHTFFDWILMVSKASEGHLPTAQYVSTNQTTATVGIITLAVFCLLYLPRTIRSYKRLSTLSLPQHGPFIPQEQSVLLTNTAWQDEPASQDQPQTGKPGAHFSKLRDSKLFGSKRLSILSVIVIYLAVSNISSSIFLGIFGAGSTAARVASSVVSVLLSLAFLYFFPRRYGNAAQGTLVWAPQDMLLVLPALLFVVTNLLGWVDAKLNNPLVCLVLAMSPGFSEEMLFRAIPISNWMRLDAKRSEVWPCVITTAAVFSLVHGLNLLAGASISSTLFQLVYAFCLGIGFAAVLLRTGSVWPAIIVHTLIDFTSFMTLDMGTVGVLTQELTIDLEFWFAVISSLVVLGWGIYLLRPSQHQAIVDLWRRKWRKA